MAAAAEDTETVKLQVDGFPAALRRDFKAEAARRGMTMQEAAVEAVSDWNAKDSGRGAGHGDS